MFQSISYKTLDTKLDTEGEWTHQITIKDDEFEETCIVDECQLLGGFQFVVDLYHKKNLNIVRNLVKFLEFESTKRRHWPLEKLIPYYDLHLKDFYKDKLNEAKKYLNLL
jgi:hypothetical protein